MLPSRKGSGFTTREMEEFWYLNQKSTKYTKIHMINGRQGAKAPNGLHLSGKHTVICLEDDKLNNACGPAFVNIGKFLKTTIAKSYYIKGKVIKDPDITFKLIEKREKLNTPQRLWL